MRSRLFMAALAATLVAAPAMVSAAASTTTQSSESATAKIKATKYRMLLTFDHMGPLKAGARVRDMSRHRNSGVVMVLAPGRVTKAKGIHGTAANFPNRGRAVIEAKDKIGLDPGARLFTFGAAVRLTRGQGVAGSNVMQKGYFNTPGGQFKLQLEPGGVPACVFFGATSRVKVTSAVGIANNKWHRVSCTRGKTGVAVRVDGKLRGFLAGQIGTIRNEAPIRIGAKKLKPPNKQFRGLVDSAYLRFLPTK